MSTFATPGPIAATVEVAGAQVRVTASDRTDTVVRVEPINEASRSDVKVANKTKVEFAGGQLSVKTTAPGDKIVLDGIDLDVRAGTVFSLLGPNGAGKTTTVNVLTTLVKADGGTVRVAGHDIATQAKAVRAAVGVTGQFAAVDELLTGQENLGPGVRQFAEYQPFTPIIETLRGLLAGAPSAGHAIAALAWCAGIAVVGYVWALSTFNKRA